MKLDLVVSNSIAPLRALSSRLMACLLVCRYAGVPYNQNEMFIRLGDIGLMEGGQPLPFDKDAASKYLKDITDVHGTVYIEVGRAAHTA